MANILRNTLIAGAAAATVAAGIASIPSAADARPFGYGGWHGYRGGWGRGFYGPRAGFGYGRGFYGPGFRVGVGPGWGYGYRGWYGRGFYGPRVGVYGPGWGYY